MLFHLVFLFCEVFFNNYVVKNDCEPKMLYLPIFTSLVEFVGLVGLLPTLLQIRILKSSCEEYCLLFPRLPLIRR